MQFDRCLEHIPKAQLVTYILCLSKNAKNIDKIIQDVVCALEPMCSHQQPNDVAGFLL